MSPSLFRIERHARLLMGGAAFLTIVALLLFKTQLVQSQPSFDAFGWYTVSQLNEGMSVAHRAENEAACRARSQRTGVTCLQGQSLNKEFFAHLRAH
nr:hypothetical protein [uncultured Noviherbaspirillum sp.]